ncbi:MAG: single-stranded DNA-binding protein [bacterium]
MANYNRIIIMGNLTRDPEYRQLPSGQAVCRFGLASNRQFKNKQTGAMIQEVCFVDIDVWGPQADSCNQYLSRGKNVLVEGRLKFDSWVDNTGQKRNKHMIVADRVTFISSSMSDQDTDFNPDQNSGNDSVKSDENNNLERVQQVQKKAQSQFTQAATTVENESDNDTEKDLDSSSGEINFKDEKPFEDDLPF